MTETKARKLITALMPIMEDFKSICKQFGVEGNIPSISIDLEDNYACFHDGDGTLVARNHRHPEEWSISTGEGWQMIKMRGETDGAEA